MGLQKGTGTIGALVSLIKDSALLEHSMASGPLTENCLHANTTCTAVPHSAVPNEYAIPGVFLEPAANIIVKAVCDYSKCRLKYTGMPLACGT